MPNQGFWIADPDTGEDRFIYYSDLEDETVQSFIRPVGGFMFPANLFLRSNLPAVPFYVKDWLPKRGKAMLYAPAKSGKSYLCLQVARCIGSGEPFLEIPTTQGTVLYIQFELGEEILQHRLKEETQKDYANVFVGTSFSLKLDKPVGQQYLRTAMDAVEPQVLILDPLYKTIVGDENESHDMMPVCDFLDELIEGYNCSILLIHHTGKDESKRGRGSTVFEDWVDSYLRMKRKSKKGEPLKVEIEPIFLRHAALPLEPIEAVLGTDFEFHRTSGEPTIKEQVDKMGQELGTLTPKELFEAGIGSNTSVYQALNELVKEGKVNKEERGRYKWQ
ncbi:MAG: AAA family ATPase [Candidatus Bathyarchaeota archaeon]